MDREAAASADESMGESRASDPTLRPDPNVLAKRVDDEIVLVQLETNRIYELNLTAAFVWDTLAEGITRAELEERMAGEFAVEPGELARELDELLRQLTSERLILTQR